MISPIQDWILRATTQPDFVKKIRGFGKQKGLVISHCDDAAHAFMIAVLQQLASQKTRRCMWILCALPRHRERIAAELELWGKQAVILPEAPLSNNDQSMADPESASEWFAVLESIAKEEQSIIITDPESLQAAAPSPASLHQSQYTFLIGDILEPRDLEKQLLESGFERVPSVISRGQFAIRGGIIDILSWQGSRPLRIELFDNEIESLREFDLHSQASTQKLEQAAILFSEPEHESQVLHYIKKTDIILSIDHLEAENADLHLLSGAAPMADEQPEEDYSVACFGSPLGSFEAGDFILDEARREQFFHQLQTWQKEHWDVAMVFANQGEEERFTELSGKHLERDLGITPLRGELSTSFTAPFLRLTVLSSSELFGRYRTPSFKKRSFLEQARATRAQTSISEIEFGDLVVHYEYGIGKFRGIHRDADGEELQIEYRDGSILSVPLEQAHLIGKYIGMGGKTPELNKLGSKSWQSTRKSAETSILDYAAQLLSIQADRQISEGFPFPEDTRWMWEFERSFHFNETPDQRRAIEETKRDMESDKAMDRLICGDVGFGKTEVAIRAAFKAVTSGKQVAILVPTTVLAEQHWRTFRERMSDYPVRIDLLNRFRSASEVKSTIKGLADGSVDIVIGTHRLVSGDVSFEKLGLVVIDEEQRFGVAHKEKFKEIFRHVDVLTLSATPIPRTLYMALMGTRDMSTIETAPANRVPVSTSICAYDERVIRDAIRREMKRGGQVFFLHNRVKSIEMMKEKISKLVPEARILIGHGQMDKDDLEVVMQTFVKGDADVLLATTIIETGIDIPNANTILIDRADRFGLADLYQLRGRVGRAGEKAYAILLLPRDMITAGDARKRINAIKEYTALGSGFKIAMRDLEIRGAGNLLGTKQSGHIAQIGFELYCQLLKESVARLKGKAERHANLSTFKADFICLNEASYSKTDSKSTLPAFLPSTWLNDSTLRIHAYRELAEANNEKTIQKIEAAWKDKYGRLPAAAKHLLLITTIKVLAAQEQINSVEIQAQRLMLHRNGDYILLEGRRFPRLEGSTSHKKLQETITLLKKI